MKIKSAVFGVLVFFVVLGISPVRAWAEDIKMKVVLVNPSDKKTQIKSVKSFLPKEVTDKDVKDTGGLNLDYDQEQALFYVSQDVELKPLETKTFEVVLADVWLIKQETLDNYSERTQSILDNLKNTPYEEQAQVLGRLIFSRLDGVAARQSDPNVSRQQHIAYYREHVATMEGVRNDIDKLEKILVTAGGPPNPELIEESDINLKSPSSKTTWILIFIVLIFIGILSGTFYFTWHRQARITENIFSREKDSSFSEFKGPTSGDGPKEPR